jgi:hypothetical protein
MKIENLYVGMVIRNYKELCKILGIEIKLSANSKNSQMKELSRYIRYHKEGQSFIVDEMYSEIKPKIENRGGGNNKKEFKNFLPVESDWNKIGIYCVYDKDNNIYIGSTLRGFRYRFTQHNNLKNNDTASKSIIENEGVFDILWESPIVDEVLLRRIEQEYINYYRFNTNWNVVNDREVIGVEEVKPKMKTIKIKVTEEEYDYVLEYLKKKKLI